VVEALAGDDEVVIDDYVNAFSADPVQVDTLTEAWLHDELRGENA
jgi:hypothetical protein